MWVRACARSALLPLHLIEQEAEKILGRKRTEVILLGPSLQCPPPKVPITSKVNTASWPSVETVETCESVCVCGGEGHLTWKP